MGKRLHVQKKHVIEYADCALFNWKCSIINELLGFTCPSYQGNCDASFCGDDSIELLKSDLKTLIGQLRTDSLNDDVLERCGLKDSELGTIGLDNIANGLGILLMNSDPDDEYIHLDWF